MIHFNRKNSLLAEILFHNMNFNGIKLEKIGEWFNWSQPPPLQWKYLAGSIFAVILIGVVMYFLRKLSTNTEVVPLALQRITKNLENGTKNGGRGRIAWNRKISSHTVMGKIGNVRGAAPVIDSKDFVPYKYAPASARTYTRPENQYEYNKYTHCEHK